MGFERKLEHIDICLKENVNAHCNYWDDVHIIHNALPEVNMGDIDLSLTLFGTELAAPIVISAITGGFEGAESINRNLAAGAAKVGVGLGLGSQRPALTDESLVPSYEVVKEFEVPLVMANIGAPQLVKQSDAEAFGIDECRRVMEMVDADVLAIHMNFLQEIVQPGGDLTAEGCLDAVGRIADELPVVAKETGAGLSRTVAHRLMKKDVIGLDVGGLGGTSFAAVEHHRAKKEGDGVLSRIGETFWDWGIPTPVSIVAVDVGLPMIATGGLRSGLDVARAISLGASAGGLARQMLAAAVDSADAVERELNTLIAELRGAMFLCGAGNIEELTNVPVVVTGLSADWLSAMEPLE
jgi:isopentenyl-diphosphate delta-isomerase